MGICRTVQCNNRYQRHRDLPEDRHPAFSAHIEIAGKSYARIFRIDVHGKEVALAMAIAWRKEMERHATNLTKWQAKIGVPGKRRSKL